MPSQSFLGIIDHNKITNHLIGVMDDETEAYLKVRVMGGMGGGEEEIVAYLKVRATGGSERTGDHVR